MKLNQTLHEKWRCALFRTYFINYLRQNLVKRKYYINISVENFINLFQASVAFNIETSHLICSASATFATLQNATFG